MSHWSKGYSPILGPVLYFVIGITNVNAMSATGVPRIAYKVVK